MTERLVVYTDGACSGNPGPTGAGACLQYKNRRLLLSRFLGQGTNNIGELAAVLMALQAVRNKDTPVTVYSDSTYVIGVLTKNWKAKENRELIAQILAAMAQFRDLRFVKVLGHSGEEGNELADKLAREAIERRDGIRLRVDLPERNP